MSRLLLFFAFVFAFGLLAPAIGGALLALAAPIGLGIGWGIVLLAGGVGLGLGVGIAAIGMGTGARIRRPPPTYRIEQAPMPRAELPAPPRAIEGRYREW